MGVSQIGILILMLVLSRLSDDLVQLSFSKRFTSHLGSLEVLAHVEAVTLALSISFSLSIPISVSLTPISLLIVMIVMILVMMMVCGG